MSWKKLLSAKRARELITGEKHSSQPARDPRSEFDRDYGRAVFAAPVRRLQDKAQVFPLEQLDAVRTRLTHSLEVSTLARSIARQATQWLRTRNEIDLAQASAIETVSMTVGLLHDIGNPPFGHAGEEAIGEWWSGLLNNDAALTHALDGRDQALSGDFRKFEGNAQTVRLVTHLQMLSDRYGLNLTAATLSALFKYTASSRDIDDGDHARAKPGYFASEERLVELVRSETGTGTARNPIAYLVEAADDTVYSTVDLEDGVKKGAFTWATLRKELLRETDRAPYVVTLIKRVQDYRIDKSLKLDGRHADEARVQLFRTFAMYDYVNAVAGAFTANYDAIMTGQYRGELLYDSEATELALACKSVARNLVYPTQEILRLELLGRQVIQGLLDFFWKAAKEAPAGSKKWRRTFPGKTFNLMSHNYRRVFELAVSDGKSSVDPLPVEYHRIQLVTDYVAGMTDTYATSLYRDLGLGSLV